MTNLAPLCFVVMPFGRKPDGQGGWVDFDAVYVKLIAPAVSEAGLQPLRADQDLVGGLIHKPMYERLILSDYAVADLTTANPNVFYEVGVRHAFRPFSTVLIGADVQRTPFDLAPDRVLPYTLSSAGEPALGKDRAVLVKALRQAREATPDSPVFQLLGDLPTPDIARLKTDVFRERAQYSIELKQRLADAREQGLQALRAEEATLGSLDDVEAGVLVDLLLSYRARKGFVEMVDLIERMPAIVRRTLLIREQYGFALNRAGRSKDAEEVLLAVIEDHGPSSETNGLLGRVYKDRWDAEREGSVLRAHGRLGQAIDAYRKGFEADWRDAYPGINAVTLMEIREPGGAEQHRLIPVVRYANQRRIDVGSADYWDHATRLELAVLERNRAEALDAAGVALASVREIWEPESTAKNLSLIRRAREAKDERIDWANEIEHELLRAAEPQ